MTEAVSDSACVFVFFRTLLLRVLEIAKEMPPANGFLVSKEECGMRYNLMPVLSLGVLKSI